MSWPGAKMYGIKSFCFLLIKSDTSLQKYPERTGLSCSLSAVLTNLKSLSNNWFLLYFSSSSISWGSVSRVASVHSTVDRLSLFSSIWFSDSFLSVAASSSSGSDFITGPSAGATGSVLSKFCSSDSGS
jgi:hypothetical protein